ncbi:MAG: hypothetical protein MJ169_03995 [Treponema sp.]|nr:hypothetical protein [Treponema sp.]
MIEVKEVKTKKQQKDFLDFPLKLYKKNPCFVPPLYSDEKKMFKPNYVYNDTCESIFFNAYKNNTIVGRIQGILQKASNELRNEKRIRFTRFDSINDQEVANALFSAIENWAKEKQMDTICGPLGYSDLDREGLLIEGFDQLSTFEEQYNAEYYQTLIENLGYQKEVDWTESKLFKPDDDDASLEKMAEFVMKRYKLKIGPAKNIDDFIKRYATEFFDLVDKSYHDIYQTVPFTQGMKNLMLENFKLIIDLNHVCVILDENEKVVCFGICFPSIAHALKKTSGKLTPLTLIKLLLAIKHPKVIDLGLVGVDPIHANKGISVIISSALLKMLKEDGIEYAETNLNLENNYAIQNQWKRFKEIKHKRRRSYIKKI